MSSRDLDVAQEVVNQLRSRARQASWATDPAAWARDVLGVHLWSRQMEIAQSVRDHKRTVVASCHGTGKALALDTPVPTPGGVRGMGDIEPGMAVLGSDGSPVVVEASTGHHQAESFRVHLECEDGVTQTITCSGDHVWPVLGMEVCSAAHAVARRVDLDGLYLGAWTRSARNMSTHQIKSALEKKQSLWLPGTSPRVGCAPEWLTRHDREVFQRRGCCDPVGNPALAFLGESGTPPKDLVRVREKFMHRAPTLLSRVKKRGEGVWYLSIRDRNLCHVLPSVHDRASCLIMKGLQDGTDLLGWRIVSVEPAGEQEVQCIQVDSPDHLYLCGERPVPTHNSMIASVLACWWISTHPVGEAIVVSTAPSYPQVNKILWEEIRKHHSTAKRRGKPLVGYVTQGDEWKNHDGAVLAFGRKPPTGDPHAFQGIHRRYVLAVLDEACGVPDEIWTGVEAITTNVGCRILAIGNPDDRNTEFGRVFLRQDLASDWNRVSVPASVTPNFTGEEVPQLLREVLVSRSWCEERKRIWGPDDPRYISKVEARFPEASKSSLFPPNVIEQSFESVPPQDCRTILRLGVDVARFGDDKNIVVSYAGRTARLESAWSGVDTTSSAHHVLRVAEEVRDRLEATWTEIRVDAVGLGAGVVDTLNARRALLPQPWFDVYEMHGSAAPPQDMGGSVQGYGNARAYWFDQLRQSVRNGSVKLEECDSFRDDLAVVLYRYKSGRLFIISKEDMRKMVGRSPDVADALAYATAPVSDGLLLGDVVSDPAEEVAESLVDQEMAAEMTISPF